MPDGEVDLQIGKEYVIYGIEFRDNCPWFYICSENDDEYPKPFAADLFEITDKQPSTYWQLNFKSKENNKNQTQLVFREWAEDASYYERLVDSEESAMIIFEHYKKLMNAERFNMPRHED